MYGFSIPIFPSSTVLVFLFFFHATYKMANDQWSYRWKSKVSQEQDQRLKDITCTTGLTLQDAGNVLTRKPKSNKWDEDLISGYGQETIVGKRIAIVAILILTTWKINVRSLAHKDIELCNSLKERKIDKGVITETKKRLRPRVCRRLLVAL